MQQNIKLNDFTWFFSKNKVTKLLIQEFYLFKYEFSQDANLNECRLKEMFTVLCLNIVIIIFYKEL